LLVGYEDGEMKSGVFLTITVQFCIIVLYLLAHMFAINVTLFIVVVKLCVNLKLFDQYNHSCHVSIIFRTQHWKL